MRVPDLASMVSDAEAEAWGHDSLVRSLNCIDATLAEYRGDLYVFAGELEFIATAGCQKACIYVTPGLTAIFAEYHSHYDHSDQHRGDLFRVYCLRALISSLLRRLIPLP